MIYFAQLKFPQTVYLKPYGFTTSLFTYVESEDENEAINILKAYYAHNYNMDVKPNIINKSYIQDRTRLFKVIDKDSL